MSDHPQVDANLLQNLARIRKADTFEYPLKHVHNVFSLTELNTFVQSVWPGALEKGVRIQITQGPEGPKGQPGELWLVVRKG